MHDRREGAMNYERSAVHRTIFAVDVEGYGDRTRTTPHRLALRDGLYRALCRAFDDAGVPWAACRNEDCGDGVFVLAPPDIPKGLFVEFLPNALAVAVHRHNLTHHPGARIRLRMALHAGEIAYDDHGVTAPSINHAFRLLDAAPLKEALKASPGVLGLITSAWFFEEVVRHSEGLDPTTFRPVRVAVKETRTTGWISLPDRPYPADASLLTRVPEPAKVTGIDDYRTWRRFRRHAQVLADREEPG
jgi:class 3 adenylate cyclase